MTLAITKARRKRQGRPYTGAEIAQHSLQIRTEWDKEGRVWVLGLLNHTCIEHYACEED